MRSHGKASIATLIALALALIPAGSASADTFLPTSPEFFTTSGQTPNGVAVNPTNNEVYVARVLNFGAFEPGTIGRYSSTGSPLSNSFSSIIPQGVAVDPSGAKVWEFNPDLFEALGGPHLRSYNATGGGASSAIPVSYAGGAVQIATDAAGNVYYPNTALDKVQVFNSAGVLQASTYPAAGTVPNPTSVAVDSQGNVYVLDTTGGGRIQKFAPDGTLLPGNPFISAPPSGAIESVAVDTSTDEVFSFQIDSAESTPRHIAAYTPSGVKWADFGRYNDVTEFGVAIPTFGPAFEGFAAHHIAVNPNTGMVYVSSADSAARVYMFKRVHTPSVTTGGFEGLTQTTAIVEGTVNPNGSPTACEFEYGITLAYELSEPCSFVPGSGTETLDVEAKLSELEPDATYHYRARAVNAGGVVIGEDATFTTPPPPFEPESKVTPPASAPTPPATSPPPVADPPAKPKALKCRKGFRKVKVRGKSRCKKVTKRNSKRTQRTNRGGVK